LDFTKQIEEPIDHLEKNQIRAQLAEAVKKLPERQREVLWLFYYEELPLRAIADLLEISPSRVCQIRATACSRLRRAIEDAQ
ncbi:MAG: sigma-70 family RNA polymerase sigma factor, partial [Pseudomonadota bacterium]